MAAELTVDSLCNVLRAFLKHVADDPETVEPGFVLTVVGVPDGTTADVLAALGGVLKIEVRELPAAMRSELVSPTDDGPELWQP